MEDEHQMTTYTDQVRAEVPAPYGVPVRCKVQIIPPGVISMLADGPPPVATVRDKRPASATTRRQAVEMRDGGQRFQEAAHRFSRSVSDIRTLGG